MFINYFCYSLKNEFSFSYDLSFSILNFVKKIGIKNFMLHSVPNIFIKDENKIKFSLNLKNPNQNELNFNTNYFRKDQPQYSRSIVIKTDYATSSYIEFNRCAQIGLKKIYKPGYHYKKAGVILM